MRSIAQALIATLLLVSASPAGGVGEFEPSPRQMQIARTVIAVDGYIARELHDEFWLPLKREVVQEDPETVKAFRATMDRAIGAAMRFQKECWASMRASYQARQIVKTPLYETTKQHAINALTLPGYREQAALRTETAEGMIRAAAQRTPFQTEQGPIYVTPELIDEVLAGLEAAAHRFSRLMDPEWRSLINEYRYPEAHVSILWDTPFSLQRELITAENGKTGQNITLLNRASETDHVAVSFASVGAPFADPKNAILRTAQATVKAIGLVPGQMQISAWRGRLSASGQAQGDTSDSRIYISVRSVELREFGGVLNILALSGSSLTDALFRRESLERALQVIE